MNTNIDVKCEENSAMIGGRPMVLALHYGDIGLYARKKDGTAHETEHEAMHDHKIMVYQVTFASLTFIKWFTAARRKVKAFCRKDHHHHGDWFSIAKKLHHRLTNCRNYTGKLN